MALFFGRRVVLVSVNERPLKIGGLQQDISKEDIDYRTERRKNGVVENHCDDGYFIEFKIAK